MDTKRNRKREIYAGDKLLWKVRVYHLDHPSSSQAPRKVFSAVLDSREMAVLRKREEPPMRRPFTSVPSDLTPSPTQAWCILVGKISPGLKLYRIRTEGATLGEERSLDPSSPAP